jgi:hypothetical protein
MSACSHWARVCTGKQHTFNADCIKGNRTRAAAQPVVAVAVDYQHTDLVTGILDQYATVGATGESHFRGAGFWTGGD